MPQRDEGDLARNRKAWHDYTILETLEAGIALHGTEVKSLRSGRVQLREGYVRVENGEAWLLGVRIDPYEQGNRFNQDPDRKRRLLLHRREIAYLIGKVQQQGLTLVPLRLYFKGNHIKLAVGVCRGKKLWDKRHDLAAKEAKREADRVTARARRDH